MAEELVGHKSFSLQLKFDFMAKTNKHTNRKNIIPVTFVQSEQLSKRQQYYIFYFSANIDLYQRLRQIMENNIYLNFFHDVTTAIVKLTREGKPVLLMQQILRECFLLLMKAWYYLVCVFVFDGSCLLTNVG